MSSHICLWFLLFSASLASSICLFMVCIYIKKWYMMSREKFKLTKEQRDGITERIRIITKSHRYKSLRQFALKWDLPENTFHNWAKKGNINLAFLIEFSEKFNIDLSWLIKGSPYLEEKTPKKSR